MPAKQVVSEHDKRMAYANERFANAGVPGWQTDRGRIYILYGPPTTIESNALLCPSERWNYDRISGVGDRIHIDFVDEAGRGDFRMVQVINARDYTERPIRD